MDAPMVILMIACGFGVVASVIFHLHAGLQTNFWALAAHLCVFLWLSFRYVVAVGSSVSDPVALIVALILVIAGLAFILAFNAAPLYHTAEFCLDILFKTASGDIDIETAKSYDKAEAAEARHDWPAALALYHEAAEKNEADREPHRRMAELLLRIGELDDALTEFRAVAELSQGEDEWCMARLRLGEVLEENAGDAAGAVAVYEDIIRRHPRGRHADHARRRIAALGGSASTQK